MGLRCRYYQTQSNGVTAQSASRDVKSFAIRPIPFFLYSLFEDMPTPCLGVGTKGLVRLLLDLVNLPDTLVFDTYITYDLFVCHVGTIMTIHRWKTILFAAQPLSSIG